MKSPFYKMIYKKLQDSTLADNLVLKEAVKIKEKGYAVNEINEILLKIREGLLDDSDIEIADDAIEEFSVYVD